MRCLRVEFQSSELQYTQARVQVFVALLLWIQIHVLGGHVLVVQVVGVQSLGFVASKRTTLFHHFHLTPSESPSFE